MVSGGKEFVGARRFGQVTRKTGLDGLHYRVVLRGDGMVEYSVLAELELTTEELLKGQTVRDRLRRLDEEKQPEIVRS